MWAQAKVTEHINRFSFNYGMKSMNRLIKEHKIYLFLQRIVMFD